MGNPILNPNIKDLYLEVITQKPKSKPTSHVTSVSVNQPVIDFGTFSKEEKREASFLLTNTGKGLLVIHDITTSCGCTKVTYSKEPVRPNGTLEVKVTYEAEQAEYINKSILVYCNAENSPLRLTIKGNSR